MKCDHHPKQSFTKKYITPTRQDVLFLFPISQSNVKKKKQHFFFVCSASWGFFFFLIFKILPSIGVFEFLYVVENLGFFFFFFFYDSGTDYLCSGNFPLTCEGCLLQMKIFLWRYMLQLINSIITFLVCYNRCIYFWKIFFWWKQIH